MSLLLLLRGSSSGGGGGGGDTSSTLSYGGNGGQLWGVYQQEITQRLTPKVKPREPWRPPPKPDRSIQRTNITEPAPIGGFFDAQTDPTEVRAVAEARERQKALNSKTISDLLRKARR